MVLGLAQTQRVQGSGRKDLNQVLVVEQPALGQQDKHRQ